MKNSPSLMVVGLIVAACLALPSITSAQTQTQAQTQGLASTSLADHYQESDGPDWAPAWERALADLRDGGVLSVPGRAEAYSVSKPIEIDRSVIVEFAPTVQVETNAETLFRITGGEVVVLRGAPGVRLVNHSRPVDKRHAVFGHQMYGSTSVISLNRMREGQNPRLLISGLAMDGFRCIDGVVGRNYVNAGGGLAELRLLDCDFTAVDIAVGHQRAEIGRLEVTGNRFHPNARYGLFVTSPITQGAQVSNNHFERIGIRALQIGGGKAWAIDNGAVEYVKAVVVENNIIMGGGHLADEHVAYIHGIIVYGNAVTINGNVVRDFHRGEPRPDGGPGRVMHAADGTVLDNIWVKDASLPDPRGRRLAGAAIYAKLRNGVVSNNVCINSGWRSVLEIKTGGREPYAVITGNILDGSSLAVNGSYGIETNIVRAIWSNNLLTNMPNVALKADSAMKSLFVNNYISDSKVGFWMLDRGSENPSLVTQNFFANVERPVDPMPATARSPLLGAPDMIVALDARALPAPSAQHWGRLALLGDTSGGDKLLLCRRVGGDFVWAPVEGGKVEPAPALKPKAPVESDDVKPAAAPRPKEVSDNLLINGDFSQAVVGHTDFLPGFKMAIGPEGRRNIRTVQVDKVERASRGQVLRIADDGGPEMNFQLSQSLDLAAGQTYEFRARLKAAGGRSSINLLVDLGDERERPTHRFAADGEWEEGQLRFVVPANGVGSIRLRLHASGLGAGKVLWIDTLELFEVGIQ